MTNDEYETAIGKLFLLKLFLTANHKGAVDGLIEELETEYIERLNGNKL